MTIAIIFLFLGLCLLVWSADRLILGAAALARNIGISPLVIGMTIIAMGSSAPEMIVSATAAFDGKTDTAIGNVIGSNIANIALILGLTALIKPLKINAQIIRREIPLMLLVTLLAGALLYDYNISNIDGILLFILFITFLMVMLAIAKRNKNSVLKDIAEQDIPENISNLWAIFWMLVGLVLLPISANILVDNAVVIAQYFGMSDLAIGLSIIAIGTSLPELAASITGVMKGEDDMAVGNVIGSNIFNILAVMGIPGIIHPSNISHLAVDRDYFIMLGLSSLIMLIAFNKKREINRFIGIILLLIFVAYQTYIFYNVGA